ncbi:MAG: hypothetical protein AAGD11_10000 [Planctomycetota bacterium]
MAVHEFGHIVGAAITGGTVAKVTLHPLAISQTDVSPNPHPLVVVWLGPIVGSLLPFALTRAVPRRCELAWTVTRFFAGFCLIANGAYIGLGTSGRIGDCDIMLKNGTPPWVMFAFGTAAIIAGLYCWHRLGSLADYLAHPELVSSQLAYLAGLSLLALLLIVSVL